MGGSGGFTIKKEGVLDSEGLRHDLWKLIYLNYGQETGRHEINYYHGLMHGKVFYRQIHFHYPSSHSFATIKNYTRDIEEGEMLSISTDPNM